jgi:hypothetical protein
MEKIGAYLEKAAFEVLPKSPIGEAIAYPRSNWTALTRFVDAGFLSIDNPGAPGPLAGNAADRAGAEELAESWQ